MIKYLILGAGAAGLTFATRLKELGETNFLILEKESEAGGLCRSAWVDGAPLDIGGGHFLDTRNADVVNFLFHFMPKEEWNLYTRDSQIDLNGTTIGHPIEANIWQMEKSEQILYLKSIAQAGCNLGEKKPEKFTDWILWKLGRKIAEEYMFPYNQKMFGGELNQLGTYWLEKLPNVSFEETMMSCLDKKAYGKQPGHATFYYPKKYGYGEVWLRMARAIEGNIEYGKAVKHLDIAERKVKTSDGVEYNAEYIITTIPWREYAELKGLPQSLIQKVHALKHTSVQVEYIPKTLNTSAHWIYYPNLKLSYHRILVRHNFCPNSKGYWTETNTERVLDKDMLFTYKNEYAYPLNTLEKPQIMSELLEYCSAHKVYGVGRWGEHCHYNSDVTVERAYELADMLS